MPWWCPGSYRVQTIIRNHNYQATKTYPFKMPLSSFDTKQEYKMKWFIQNMIIGNEYEFLQNFYDGQITGHISVGNPRNTNGYKFFATTSRGIIQNPNSDHFKNQHHKDSFQASLLLTWINFNPSMDELLDHYKEWNKISYQFLKFGNGWVISAHTFLGMWLLLHAGIKVNPRW